MWAWIDPGTIIYGEHYQLLWGWCPPTWVLCCIGARAIRKRIVDRHSCESLLALVRMGRARIIKEYEHGKPVFTLISASGSMIGTIGDKYKYLFEKVEEDTTLL